MYRSRVSGPYRGFACATAWPGVIERTPAASDAAGRGEVVAVGRIVVGVDGSPQSRAALHWAVEEARYRGATVETVYVFENTPSWRLYGYREGMGLAGPAAGRGADEEPTVGTEAQDAEHAKGLVDQLVDELPGGDVAVESVIIEDREPARALVERSEGADMLVVGSRGRGEFAELLLGSVSHQCVTHARCPVVIVRSRPTA